MYIALIICIIIVIGIVTVVFFRGAGRTLKPVVIDVISAEMVITFFKRPDVVEKLRQNKNLLAVAVKDDTQNSISLACFNKETNQVEAEFISYQFNKMEEDLKTMFGDKSMIVLS